LIISRILKNALKMVFGHMFDSVQDLSENGHMKCVLHYINI